MSSMEPRQTKPTLKALAEQLGLGQGTVSRALNGYPDISELTRQRVREAADAMGYRANPTARQLARGVSETVAYLMSRGDHLGEPFTAQLLAGMAEALSPRGWDLQVVVMDDEDAGAAVDRLVRSGRVGGVILSRVRRSDSRVAGLLKSGLPFVVHGRTSAPDDYAWFDVDGHGAFRDAVDHLVGLGHGRIAFVGGPSYFTFSHMRREGYLEGCRDNGLMVEPKLDLESALTDTDAERVVGDCLDTVEAQPTAILCATDTQALGALAACRSRGLTPGNDISVMGYDGLHWGRHSNPPLTTMAQPQGDAGRRLGEMLLALVDGDDPKQHQELRRAQLVRRKSDGPAPRERDSAATTRTNWETTS